MSTKLKDENVKMNLTVPKEFADLLTTRANNEFLRPATYVKRLLMKLLLQDGDNQDKQSINENGNRMD